MVVLELDAWEDRRSGSCCEARCRLSCCGGHLRLNGATDCYTVMLRIESEMVSVGGVLSDWGLSVVV